MNIIFRVSKKSDAVHNINMATSKEKDFLLPKGENR